MQSDFFDVYVFTYNHYIAPSSNDHIIEDMIVSLISTDLQFQGNPPQNQCGIFHALLASRSRAGKEDPGDFILFYEPWSKALFAI